MTPTRVWRRKAIRLVSQLKNNTEASIGAFKHGSHWEFDHTEQRGLTAGNLELCSQNGCRQTTVRN